MDLKTIGNRFIIVAYDENYLIGNDNNLPWNIPEDLKQFKAITSNNIVIMGRKTWDSIPRKPLPERLNVIISRNQTHPVIDFDNIMYFHELNLAFETLENWFPTELQFIIGGSEIYQQALETNKIDGVVASEICGKFEGNKYFPSNFIEKYGFKKEYILNTNKKFTTKVYSRC